VGDEELAQDFAGRAGWILVGGIVAIIALLMSLPFAAYALLPCRGGGMKTLCTSEPRDPTTGEWVEFYLFAAAVMLLPVLLRVRMMLARYPWRRSIAIAPVVCGLMVLLSALLGDPGWLFGFLIVWFIIAENWIFVDWMNAADRLPTTANREPARRPAPLSWSASMLPNDPPAARRERVQAQFGAFYDEVLALFCRHDPIHICAPSVNPDEYAPEVETVLPRLAAATCAAEIQQVLYEEFVRWFGSTGEHADYADLALDLWAAWGRYTAA
jgi:hypothetical protein